MLEVFPPAIQIIIFYLPVILVILIMAHVINVLLNRGWNAIQRSSYAWVGTTLALTSLFYLRMSSDDYPDFVKLLIIPAIFIGSLVSYFQIRKTKKPSKK